MDAKLEGPPSTGDGARANPSVAPPAWLGLLQQGRRGGDDGEGCTKEGVQKAKAGNSAASAGASAAPVRRSARVATGAE
jgi:hypothetical protein